MPFAPPQKKNELKVSPRGDAPKRSSAKGEACEEEKLALPSWRALAATKDVEIAPEPKVPAVRADASATAVPEAPSAPAPPVVEPVVEAVEETPLQAMDEEVSKVTDDTLDPEIESAFDAERTAGLTEGTPGPSNRQEVEEEERDAAQAAAEGRVATEADRAEQEAPEEVLPPTPQAAQVAESQIASSATPIMRRTRGPPLSEGRAHTLIAQSAGEALSSEALSAFAESWGQDFASVVIHRDVHAAQAALMLGAEAFAIQEHIYFAEGAFEPLCATGMELLAHELAHVVQFRRGDLATTRGLSVAASPMERAADALVERLGVPSIPKPAQERVQTLGQASSKLECARGPPAAATPPRLAAQPRAPLAALGAPVLRRSTDGAKQFFSQGYFQQAAGWSEATTSIDSEMSVDAAADTATFPKPTAALGPEQAPETPVPSPASTLSVDGEIPLPEGSAEAFELPESDTAATPTFPTLGALSAGAEGDTSAAEARLDGAIDGVPTDFEVATTPGAAPEVELPGASDPAQTQEQEAAARDQATSLAQQAALGVEQGPGPEQVQPGSCHETNEPLAPEAATLDPLGPIAEMDTLQGNPIPDDVKAATDAEGQEQLTASMTEVNTSLDTAASDHDAAREEEIQKAQEEQDTLNADANAEQQAKVTEARSEIDTGRSTALSEQEAAVADLETQSAEEKGRVEGDIDNRVREDQGAIEDEFSNAERDAEAQKTAKEAEAQREKDAASQSSDNDSWWDRALDAVASFFDALLDAVNAIFDALVEAVGAIIEAAKSAVVAIIDAIRDFAISMVQAFGEFLKGLVDLLLADLFPELAAALNELIDAAVELAVAAINFIAEQLKAGILALLDSIAAALNELLAALRAAINAALNIAKAALTGDWAALGRMILDAALKLVGIPPESFYQVAASALGAIDTILADPGAFCGNVINALASGFENFGSNILTHLQAGFFAWIVGPLGELGITLPSNWDLPGIFGLVLQVLGLTQEGIRAVITEELGETAGVIFDFVWRYVAALIEGGLEGLWTQIQNDLGMLYDMVVDGIKNWLIETVVTQAIIRVATMFNPAGALLNVLVTVYNVVMWLRENVQRIWGVVEAIVGMLAPLAAGNIGPAAAAIEGALASLVPIAISLLANLLGVGGITAKVREVLEGVRETVRGAIRNLIRRVRGLFTGGDDAPGEEEEEEDPDAEGSGDQELGKQVTFSADGESHRQWIDVRGTDAVLMVASSPMTVNAKVQEWQGKVDELPDDKQGAARAAVGQVSSLLAQTEADADACASQQASEDDAEGEAGFEDSSVESGQDALKVALAAAFEAFGETGVPFEPVAIAAAMLGGTEAVGVEVSGDHLTAKVDGGDAVSKLDAVLAGPVGQAQNAAGRTLVNTAKTAVNTEARAIAEITVAGGMVNADDQTAAQTKAQTIAEHVGTLGRDMKIASLARATQKQPIPAVPRTFTRLVARNASAQSTSDTEFDRQLRNQQNGINELSIDAWVVNFDAYSLSQTTYQALDEHGRAAVLNELKRRAQAKLDTPGTQKANWNAALAAINATNPADPNSIPNFGPLSRVTSRFDNVSTMWREHREQILAVINANTSGWDEISSRFAILHNADQIAGGFGEIPPFPAEVPEPGPGASDTALAQWRSYLAQMEVFIGPSNVNSSIGPQWKEAIKGLRDEITAERPAPSWAIWQLNLQLSAV